MRTLLDLLSELLIFLLQCEACQYVELTYLLFIDKQFNVEFLGQTTICPDVFFVQRSAEDQPDEQEKGSWESGTKHKHTDMFTVDWCYYFTIIYYYFVIAQSCGIFIRLFWPAGAWFQTEFMYVSSIRQQHTIWTSCSLCLRLYTVSTQLSVLPMLNVAQLYSILLPWASVHILYNIVLIEYICYTNQ